MTMHHKSPPIIALASTTSHLPSPRFNTQHIASIRSNCLKMSDSSKSSLSTIHQLLVGQTSKLIINHRPSSVINLLSLHVGLVSGSVGLSLHGAVHLSMSKPSLGINKQCDRVPCADGYKIIACKLKVQPLKMFEVLACCEGRADRPIIFLSGFKDSW